MSCLIPDPPPLCRDEAWFFEIAHTRLFTLGPRQLEPSAYPDYERAEQASRQLPSVQFSMAVVWLLYRIRLAFTAVLPWLSGFALICFVGAGAMQLSPMRRNGVWVAASICALVIASRIGLLTDCEAVCRRMS